MTGETLTPSQRWLLVASAYHEAGHAVVAHHYSHELVHVSLGIEPLSGSVQVNVPEPQNREEAEAQARICLAGDCAMRRVDRELLIEHCGGLRDLMKAEYLVLDFVVPEDGMTPIAQLNRKRARAIDRLNLETEALVSRLWPAVEVLHTVLVERTRVYGPEAVAVIERALSKVEDEPPK